MIDFMMGAIAVLFECVFVVAGTIVILAIMFFLASISIKYGMEAWGYRCY